MPRDVPTDYSESGIFDHLADEYSQICTPILGLYPHGDAGAIVLSDSGGFVLSQREWDELKLRVDAFYKDSNPDEIASHNYSIYRDKGLIPDIPKTASVTTVRIPRRAHPGHIYMITDGRATKVGTARNPAARFKDLQSATATPLTLLHSIEVSDAMMVEACLHVRFHDQRVKGEWFSLAPEHIEWFKSQTPDSLMQLTKKGVPHERITSWQGLAKQLRRDFEAVGSLPR
jgi:Meiotically up-regulated gene 113